MVGYDVACVVDRISCLATTVAMYVTTLCVNIKNPLYLCVIICFSRNDLSGSVVRSLRVDNLFPDGSQTHTNVLHCILLS